VWSPGDVEGTSVSVVPRRRWKVLGPVWLVEGTRLSVVPRRRWRVLVSVWSPGDGGRY